MSSTWSFYFYFDQLCTADWDLAIHPVQMSDDGLYQCQVGAKDMVGPVVSDMVSLTIMVEPGVPRILQGEEVEMVEGKEDSLECWVEGRPRPEVSKVKS